MTKEPKYQEVDYTDPEQVPSGEKWACFRVVLAMTLVTVSVLAYLLANTNYAIF